MQLVYVEWVDSYGCASTWTEVGELDPQILKCRSVGWLAYDGPDCKVVDPHIADRSNMELPPQGRGDFTIPAAAFLRLIPLQEPS